MHARQSLAMVLVVSFAPTLALSQQFTGSKPIDHLPAPVVLEQRDHAASFQDVIARVGDDVFIGGQPTERGLRDMRAQGVTTVVNLRTPEEMRRDVKFDEAALVAQLGMKYVYLPVRGNEEYPFTPETVAKFTAALRNADGKVLLHCTVGWRASHLWAAYLIRERGISVDGALANARAINLMDSHHMGSGPMPVEEFLGRRLHGAP